MSMQEGKQTVSDEDGILCLEMMDGLEDDEMEIVFEPMEAGVPQRQFYLREFLSMYVTTEGPKQDLMHLSHTEGIKQSCMPSFRNASSQSNPSRTCGMPTIQILARFLRTMEMGSSDDSDLLKLVFKEDGKVVEMDLQLFDQSAFVSVAYALLDLCPGN